MANWTLRGLSQIFPFRILDTHRHRLPPFTHINPYIFIIAGQHYGTSVLVCQTRTPLWQWFQKYTHFPLRNTCSLTETYFSLLSCRTGRHPDVRRSTNAIKVQHQIPTNALGLTKWNTSPLIFLVGIHGRHHIYVFSNLSNYANEELHGRWF